MWLPSKKTSSVINLSTFIMEKNTRFFFIYIQTGEQFFPDFQALTKALVSI